MSDTLTGIRLGYREAMAVDLPDIDQDGVKVEKYTITSRDAMMGHLDFMSHRRGLVSEGQVITRLWVDGKMWMSDTPDEKVDHSEAFFQMQKRGGRVLIHGLGLGMVVQAALLLDNVEHVDVVEHDQRVIDLIGSVYADRFPGKITLHHGDAYTYQFPRGQRWTVAWHDIWSAITDSNMEGMTRLHRRYGIRSDWQGSWGRYEVQRMIRADRRYGF